MSNDFPATEKITNSVLFFSANTRISLTNTIKPLDYTLDAQLSWLAQHIKNLRAKCLENLIVLKFLTYLIMVEGGG